MKKTMIAFMTGLLFSSLTMAMTNANASSHAMGTVPCPKNFNKSIAINDKRTNFYNIAKADVKSSVKTSTGRSAN